MYLLNATIIHGRFWNINDSASKPIRSIKSY